MALLYIEDLRKELLSNYQVTTDEIASVCEDYEIHAQTIFDETQSVDEVIKQLGTPIELAKAIAEENGYIKRDVQLQQSIPSSYTPQQSPLQANDSNQTLRIILGIVFLIFGLPTVLSIFGVLISLYGLPLAYIGLFAFQISTPTSLSIPLMIILIVAAVSIVVVITFIFIFAIKMLIQLVRWFFTNQFEYKKYSKKARTVFISATVITLFAHIGMITLITADDQIRNRFTREYNEYIPFDQNTYYDLNKTIAIKDVDQLHIRADMGTIHVTQSSDKDIHISAHVVANDIEKFVTVKDKTLTIKTQSEDDQKMCFGCFDLNSDTVIVIALPDKFSLKDLSVELNAGSIDFDQTINTTSENTDIEVNAGNVYIENLKTSMLTSVVNAGNMQIFTLDAQKSRLEVNAGTFDITTFTGNTSTIEVNAGSMTIETSTVKQIDKKVTVGSLNIQNESR